MIQYYRDLWPRCSEMLALLTSLGECCHTKVTKTKSQKMSMVLGWGTLKAFKNVKATIVKESWPIQIIWKKLSFTDASWKQIGAVITQDYLPIVIFNRKHTETQHCYSATEIELLTIVDTLKEFKGMMWGQRIKVYTDPKNDLGCPWVNLWLSIGGENYSKSMVQELCK